jgi:hypothetical protein
MAMKNKYSKNAKISEAKIREIVRLFSVDLTALQIAAVAGVNRNTVNRILAHLRACIAAFCEQESPIQGIVEVDESYFGARRVKGIKGRGHVEKLLSLDYSSAMVGCLQRLCRTARRPPSRQLYAVALPWKASFTLMAGVVTTGL